MTNRAWAAVRLIARRWARHKNTSSAAAIAYYALFTFAPTLAIATAVAASLVTEDDAERLVKELIEWALGPAGEQVAGQVRLSAWGRGYGAIAAAISLLLLLYGASAMFWQLRAALNEVFGQREHSLHQAVLTALIGRLFAALFVVAAGGIVLAGVVGSVVLQSLETQQLAWGLLHYPVTFLLDALLLALTFKLLPASHPRVRETWLGVLVAALLFELGKWAFGLYVSYSFVSTIYGPSASLVAFLVWVYYSAQIVLLGAEIAAMNYENSEDAPPTTSSASKSQ